MEKYYPFIKRKRKHLQKMTVTGRLFLLFFPHWCQPWSHLLSRQWCEGRQRDTLKWRQIRMTDSDRWVQSIDLDKFHKKELTELNTLIAESQKNDVQELTEGVERPQTGMYHICSFRRGLWATLNIADLPEGRKRFIQMLRFQCLGDNRVAKTGLVGMES